MQIEMVNENEFKMKDPITPIFQMSMDDGLVTNTRNRLEDQSIYCMLDDWDQLAKESTAGHS